MIYGGDVCPRIERAITIHVVVFYFMLVLIVSTLCTSTHTCTVTSLCTTIVLTDTTSTHCYLCYVVAQC